MKDGKAYFSQQEEKISNTYLNATGEDSTEDYGSIFKQKNYWIGVAVGVAGVLIYQKVMKKK
jgi:hypothetical protein